MEDEGTYESHALESYQLKFVDETAEKRPIAFWETRAGRKVSGKKKKGLPESPLWTYEKELLRESPRMFDFLFREPQELQN